MKKILLALLATVKTFAIILRKHEAKSARRKRECECDLDGYYEFAEYPASISFPRPKEGDHD